MQISCHPRRFSDLRFSRATEVAATARAASASTPLSSIGHYPSTVRLLSVYFMHARFAWNIETVWHGNCTWLGGHHDRPASPIQRNGHFWGLEAADGRDQPLY